MSVLLFILGAILGSFYLCIGTRLPIKEKIGWTRSHCDNCEHVLKWYELIPIFSYVLQMGRCRVCDKKIGSEYLFLELVTGILFVMGFWYYGLTIKFGIYLVIVSVALIIFVSDFKYMIILDSPLVVGSILVIILKYFEVGLRNTFIAIVYGVVLFVTMYLIKLFGDYIYKKESMGGGDIKLCFFLGLVLGYENFGFRLGLISLIFAAFLAMPYAITNLYLNKKNELPLGPFLISAMIIIFVFIEKFMRLLVFFDFS